MDDFFAFMAAILGIAAFIAGILAIVVLSMRAYGPGQCHRWGTQTGIATKFVTLGFMDTGTCLARTPSGRWVKNTQYVAYLAGSHK